jgi:hypothetical protein
VKQTLQYYHRDIGTSFRKTRPFILNLEELFPKEKVIDSYEHPESQKLVCEFIDSMNRSTEPDMRISGKPYDTLQSVVIYRSTVEEELSLGYGETYRIMLDQSACIEHLSKGLLPRKEEILDLLYALKELLESIYERFDNLRLLEGDSPLAKDAPPELPADIPYAVRAETVKILLLSFEANGFLKEDVYDDITRMGRQSGVDDTWMPGLLNQYSIHTVDAVTAYVTLHNTSYPIDSTIGLQEDIIHELLSRRYPRG